MSNRKILKGGLEAYWFSKLFTVLLSLRATVHIIHWAFYPGTFQ